MQEQDKATEREEEIVREEEVAEKAAEDGSGKQPEEETSAHEKLSKMSKEELRAKVRALTEEGERCRKEAEDAKAEAETCKKVALQAAEFQTLYTRLKADFDNYKRRNAGISEKAVDDATVSLAEKLLPVLDNFGRAIAAIKDESVLTGVRMIEQQLYDVLSGFHVTKYESLGEEFDHNLHDAVLMQAAPEDQVGKVIHVMQEGYRYKDRIVRTAKVIVGKAAGEE